MEKKGWGLENYEPSWLLNKNFLIIHCVILSKYKWKVYVEALV